MSVVEGLLGRIFKQTGTGEGVGVRICVSEGWQRWERDETEKIEVYREEN